MFMGHCVFSLLSWEGALLEPWKPLISISHLHLCTLPSSYPGAFESRVFEQKGNGNVTITSKISLHFCTSYSNHFKQKYFKT